MKIWFEGFCSAFSMYSIFPVPGVRWTSESRRYALCFFPLIGVTISGILLLWYWVCVRLQVTGTLFAAVAALLPTIISGGIHMDGFMDTMDAQSSHALREKKMEILKDPHVGAFGALACAGSLLLQFGLWHQVYQRPWLVSFPAMGAVLSRALNGLSIATFPCAKESGLVYAFSSSAARPVVRMSCLLFAAASCFICMGISLRWGCVMTLAATACFFVHKRFCIWEFGGNTGDLAGFLLHNVELICLITAAVGGTLG